MINLEKIKQRKKDLHLTNQELAERSGVPLGTINKIFSGATKSPKYKCLRLEGSNFRLGGIAPITRAVPSF